LWNLLRAIPLISTCGLPLSTPPVYRMRTTRLSVGLVCMM
jgi:hypothetical protein